MCASLEASLVLLLRTESVVGAERVRHDPQVADARVIRQHDDRWRRATRTHALIADVCDGLRRVRATSHGVGDRSVELARAVSIEQTEQAQRVRRDGAASSRSPPRSDGALSRSSNRS